MDNVSFSLFLKLQKKLQKTNQMNKQLITTILLCFISLSMTAQQWPEVKPEAKAGARWWWLGSAVDKENLQWNMQEYANHGIGALEITPIYGVQGNQANNIPYLSDQWMEMLREVQKNGQQMGIEVDMATGTGWPFGGPWVPLEESACKAVFVDTLFRGLQVENLDLKAPEKEAPYCKLQKVMAFCPFVLSKPSCKQFLRWMIPASLVRK